MSDAITNEQPHMVSPGGGHLGSREVSRIEYEQRGRIYELEAEVARLREALQGLLHAVCHPTGFAAAVRRDSGKAYPWEPLDRAEEKAREAIAAKEETK